MIDFLSDGVVSDTVVVPSESAAVVSIGSVDAVPIGSVDAVPIGIVDAVAIEDIDVVPIEAAVVVWTVGIAVVVVVVDVFVGPNGELAQSSHEICPQHA
jgi:hypothetical protein